MSSPTRLPLPDHASEQLVSALLPDIAARRPAPPPVAVAALPAPGTSSVDVNVHDVVLLGIARIDPSGRFHERALLRALGWNPGRTLDIDTTRDTIVIVPAVGGAHRVTQHGAIALPAAPASCAAFLPVDRWCSSRTHATSVSSCIRRQR